MTICGPLLLLLLRLLLLLWKSHAYANEQLISCGLLGGICHISLLELPEYTLTLNVVNLVLRQVQVLLRQVRYRRQNKLL